MAQTDFADVFGDEVQQAKELERADRELPQSRQRPAREDVLNGRGLGARTERG